MAKASNKTAYTVIAMVVIIAIYFGVAVVGPDALKEWEASQSTEKNSIQYFRDSRTGICFAYVYGGGISIATVDCSKVQSLLTRAPTFLHPL